MGSPGLRKFLLFVFIIPVTVCATETDSLRQQLSRARHHKDRAEILLQMGNLFRFISVDSTHTYITRTLYYAKNTGPDFAARSYLLYGKHLNDETLYDSALFYFQKGLRLASNLENRSLTAQFFRELGYTQSLKRNYSGGLDLVHRSLKEAEQAGSIDQQVTALVTIAEIYRRLEKMVEARHYIDLAAQRISGQDVTAEILGYYYHRKAAVLNESGLEDSSQVYSAKNIELSKENHNLHYLATSLNEAGFAYEKHGHFKQAADHYTQAIKIWEPAGFVRYATHVRMNLARVLHKLGRQHESFAQVQQIITPAEKNKWLEILLQAYSLMVEQYTELDSHEKALEYHRLENKTLLAIRQNEWSKEIEEIRSRFRGEQDKRLLVEKENQLARLTAESETRNREFNQLLIGLLVAGGFLIFSIGGVWTIRRKNNKLEKKHGELEAANTKLESLINQKEVLLKEVHHRVKNNLAVLSGLLRLQMHYLDNDDARKILINSQNRIHSIAMVHEKLYAIEELDQINFSEFASGLLRHLHKTFSNGETVITPNIQCENIRLNVNQTVPLALILNEFITNSYKYAFEAGSGEIGILLRKLDEKKAELKFYDSGPGLQRPEEAVDSSSLGLNLVNILVEQIGGKMDYRKSEKAEFTIHFELEN